MWIDGDTNAGSNFQCRASDRHGSCCRLQDTADNRAKVLATLLGNKDHNELVATKASQRITFTQYGFQALGKRDQELVTKRMTIFVVDRLEPVEIKKSHRQTGFTSVYERHRLL